jgi:transposase
MGKPYSLDLRQRICGYVAAGNSCRAVGRIFGVSAATAVRYAADHRERGEVSPKPQGRPSKKPNAAPASAWPATTPTAIERKYKS